MCNSCGQRPPRTKGLCNNCYMREFRKTHPRLVPESAALCRCGCGQICRGKVHRWIQGHLLRIVACMCGCGRPVGPAAFYVQGHQPRTSIRGRRHSPEARAKMSLAGRGRKQSKEHVQKRIRRGAAHYNWKADDIAVKSGRSRALRLYPESVPCVKCAAAKSERHHKDGNTRNNAPENIERLCRRCHMLSDEHREGTIARAKALRPIAIASRWDKHRT